jgi:MFS family permease
LGINVMAGYVGLMVGPAVGGLLVTHVGWRWIFLINVPIAIITLANGWSLLGAERQDRAEGGTTSRTGKGIDWPGSILLALTLTMLFVPLTLLPYWGLASAKTLGMIGAFMVLLVAFVLVEERVGDPVLDLDIVRKNRVFAAGTFAALLNYAAVFGLTTFTAVYLEVVENYSAQKAGLLLLAQPIMMTVLSPVFGQLSDRIGTRVLAAGGMLLGAVGILQLALLPSSPNPLRVVLALAIVGIGMAAFSSPNTSAVMGSVRRDQLSLASGFLATMRTVGQGVSVALLGAIAASQLGPAGARVLFLGEKASRGAASAFSTGYRTAMFAGVGLAVGAALVSWLVGGGAGEGPQSKV